MDKKAGIHWIIPVLLIAGLIFPFIASKYWITVVILGLIYVLLGLNHVLVKLSAFMTGAAIGGIAGIFFATYQGFANPTSFTFFESALILAILVLDGLGSTKGVVIAALLLTILPEVLRDFSEYRILMFGLLMVLMMIWRPRGLVHKCASSLPGCRRRKGCGERQ